jgi:hypothetical protein
MPDYVPRVTKEDVLRVLERDFDREDHERVLRLLAGHGGGSGGAARVHLAILKLSGGTVGGVREHLAVAKTDFRDTICAAEYPEFSRLGFVGVGRLTRHEREAMRTRDWQQYESWLTRK